MPTVERVPAIITDVKRVSSGTYVEMPGWDPNYVIVDDKLKVSRVNLIGVITQAELDGNIARYTLDDSSATITLRSYDSTELEAKSGDLVLVVGRPRAYQNEIYLVPELIRTIDPKWAEYRKKQLDLLEAERDDLPKIEAPSDDEKLASAAEQPANPTSERSKEPAPTPKKVESDEPVSDTEKLYAMIERLDSGDGADLSDVLADAEKDGIENAEKAIHHMLEMGDIFEIRAGKLKVL